MGEYSKRHYYSVDLDDQIVQHSCGLLLVHDDKEADEIVVVMTRSGVPYIPNPIPTIIGYMQRSDGVTVRFDMQNDMNTDGVVGVTLCKECYEVEGRFTLSVEIYAYEESRSTILVIDGYVRRVKTDNLVYP